jgi:transcription elongation factor Elf1
MFYLKIKNLFQKIIKKKKSGYVDAEIISETYKTVIDCPSCKQKLRVPVLQNKKLRITCQKCGNGFTFDCRKHRFSQKLKVWSMVMPCLLLCIVDVALPFYLLSRRDSSSVRIKNENEDKIRKMQSNFVEERRKLKNRYDAEITQINIAELNMKAKKHYEEIWSERKNLDTKYAITPREKAQLEMLALSKDKTKSIEDIIRSIALKAAPRNSTINVYTSSAGKYGSYECVTMLDTGASMTVISLELAQKTGQENLNKVERRSFSTANGLLSCPIVGREIIVGNLDRKQLVAVNLKDNSNLLGIDFFESKGYIIDASSKSIYVWSK